MRKAAEIALQEVHARGLQGETFLMHERDLAIEVNCGQVETFKESEQNGLGLRVLNKDRLGFAYSSDLSETAIRETVKNAVHTSAFTAPDKCNCLPEGKQAYQNMDIFDASLTRIDLETKINMAREVETVARNHDHRIKLVERAGYEEGEYTALIMNSCGLDAFSKGSYCGLHVSLVASEGDDTQNGFSFATDRKMAHLDPGSVGEEAAMKAIRSLGAKTISSGQLPCVMEPYVVTRFITLLSSSVYADAVRKGKSLLADKMRHKVGTRQVTLIDDATNPAGMAGFPFDDEGVASARNVIINEGYLRGFLYDCKYGRKAGVKSTGNGIRGSFRSLPAIGSTNLYLSPGSLSPNDLIADIAQGLYITDVMGMHTANPITGDFSVGATGIMIEQGQLTFPVRGITIAGNLLSWLQNLDAAGSDIRFFGRKAAPSIRLSSIDIGGH